MLMGSRTRAPHQTQQLYRETNVLQQNCVRGVQHQDLKISQAERLLFSVNSFEKEVEDVLSLDEDCDSENAIADMIEQVQGDIYEADEIRFCNWMKALTDKECQAQKKLIYSREVPTKSFAVKGIPFRPRGVCDSTIWLRFEIFQETSTVIINIKSLDVSKHDFFFSCKIDRDSYCQIQKEQSIKICLNEFG
jgi:hypothetical protein